MPGSRSRGGCGGSSRCRSPGPIEPPRSRRGRALSVRRTSDREDADDRPREHGRRQRQRQRQAGQDISIEPAPDEPAGGRVLADLRRDGGGRGTAPPRAKRRACAPPRGEPGRCRDQYQDDHRHTNQFARGAIRETLHDRGCPTTDCACGAGTQTPRRPPAPPLGARPRAPARLVADRPRDGRAPRAGLPGGRRHRVRAAGGGDAPGRLGTPDVCASRARLRPPRRARERVAGGAPDEPRTDISFWLSGIGDVYAIPALVAVTAIVAAAMLRWRVAAFIVTAIAVEAATYRVATFAIDRQRPHVPRLDDLPVNDSYFSGPHGGVRRGLLRHGAVDHLLGAKSGWARAICGSSPSSSRCWLGSRGCTGGCTTRRTWPRASSSASAPHGCPHRRSGRGRRRHGGRPPHESDRRHRTRGQEHRGRPARASPHARRTRRQRSALGRGGQEPQGAEAGRSACSSRESTCSSCGAGMAWRSAVWTCWPEPTRRWP